MKEIRLQLNQQSNPLAVGLFSFMTQQYREFCKTIKSDVITIGDTCPCDISVRMPDIENKTYEHAKVIFISCMPKQIYTENMYSLPLLNNADFYPLYIKRNIRNKTYKCASIHATHNTFCGKLIRKIIHNDIDKFSDLMIIDAKIVKSHDEDKTKHFKNDYFDFLDKSEFMLCSPGVMYDTYRYYEALMCNCIPLTLYMPSYKFVMDHPIEYTWTMESIKNYVLPKYDLNVLQTLQKQISPYWLITYISDIVNKHCI